ncbi:MAG: S9 family peptidase [Anaerolineae bacterium]|nr:S9 family peptidase [Gemmatimonadaceae bacterium]
MITFRVYILSLLLTAAPVAAQSVSASPTQASTRKALTAEAFDQWRSIRGERLSDDGKWLIYSLVPQVGDGEVVVTTTDRKTEHRHTRGFVGRPQNKPGATGPNAAITFPNAELTPDARFAIFTIEPARAEVDKAKRDKKKPADQPKTSLAIMSLPDGRVTVVPKVKSFRLPKESSRWLAYLLEPTDTTAAKKENADSAAAKLSAGAPASAAAPGQAPRPISPDTTDKRKEKKKDFGSTLVLRDLASGAEVRLDDVTAYTIDEQGTSLGYTVSSRTRENDGAYIRALSEGRTRTLLKGVGNYKALVFDKAGTQAAFVSDQEEYDRDSPRYRLYHAVLKSPTASEIVAPRSLGDTLLIIDRARLEFSDDGRILQFGVAPAIPDSIPADSLAEKAVLDLWHYRDPRLQPQQRIEAERDRGRSWPAVYHIATRKHVVLGNDTLPQLRFSRDFRAAVATTSVPYRIEAMWGEGGNDIYVVDATTGKRTLVKSRVPFGAELSPGAKYVLFFGSEGKWFSYSLATRRTIDLTGAVPKGRFDQETWDVPSQPAPWGVGGWTKGDASVLIYDRFDIWEFDPEGRRSPRMVTDSVGRKRSIVFRYVALDTTQRAIDPSKPLLLSAEDEETKASGFWRDRLGASAQPESLVMGNSRYGPPSKARKADVYLATNSTFQEFPNLWTSGPDFRDAVRITEANPQQKDYRWGTVQLVKWRSGDGVPLSGLLYKPEDFDPKKKYPMVVYFYEQLSDTRYNYNMTFPRNTVQPTYYVSNGYLVFFPDIAYTKGYPGPSALKSIVPGVQMLLDSGFVKEDGVGISGQSWGGYQVAYMITQTNLFKAAFAGAPVANMTSAYGGIRWESGLARSFQYERTQSRIGGSLWAMPMRYIENSPLFSADRVNTPLLMMHNDADGAVPWYQGIEMFVALRRLGKEVYLVNYNGDAHNPTKRANQQDIAMRQMQFFDYHLRGMPAPQWMKEGIPFLDKGRDQLPTQVATPVQAGAPGGTTQP